MRGTLLSIAIAGLACSLVNSPTRAGEVTATISGGNLYVYGDDTSNQIAISAPDNNGEVIVTASTTMSGESTTINGEENGTVVLSGWNRGIYCFLYAGNDHLTISSAMVNGFTHLDLGRGNDSLFVGVSPMTQAAQAAQQATNLPPDLLFGEFDPSEDSVIISQGLLVLGGQGIDSAELQQLWVGGTAEINLGSEVDEVLIGTFSTDETTVSFQQNLVIIPGAARDNVTLNSFDVGGDLIVDDSTGRLILRAMDIRVGRSAFIYGTSEDDRVELTSIILPNVLRIFTEGGNDLLIVSADAGDVFLYPGAGVDRVRVVDTDCNRLEAFLDPGDDDMLVQRGNIQRLNAFGSSGNDLFNLRFVRIGVANLYGEAGTDTYQGVPGNQIGKLNLYSIENQQP